MQKTVITIPLIVLEWSEWVAWDDLKVDTSHDGGVRAPIRQSGVYEPKCVNAEERLTIGKASNLRRRIKQGLVKGTTPHSAGERIRQHEDVSRIVVRWATTDRPAAVEEELHRRYEDRFGRLPKYTLRT